jgi:hypothetical protein
VQIAGDTAGDTAGIQMAGFRSWHMQKVFTIKPCQRIVVSSEWNYLWYHQCIKRYEMYRIIIVGTFRIPEFTGNTS